MEQGRAGKRLVGQTDVKREGRLGKITGARAYANNEVSIIAWDIDAMIDGCLGFDIVRVRVDGSEPPNTTVAYFV
jgi:hypothetical protein